MSTTDVSGIRSGGKIETERKDKSSDMSSAAVESSSRAISDSVEFSAAAQQLASLQDELASILKVSRQTINSIETGKFDPSLKLVMKMTRYFKLDLEKIFIFQEDE